MSSNKIPLVTAGASIPNDQFWNSVHIYHSSPHFVNRRLLGVTQVFLLDVTLNTNYQLKNLLKFEELYSQAFRLKEITLENVNQSFITNILDQYGDIYSIENKTMEDMLNAKSNMYISVRILHSRSTKYKDCIEVVLIDKENAQVTFSAISLSQPTLAPNFTYEIELDKSNLLKICVDFDNIEDNATIWLTDKLFPKLISWAENKMDIAPKQKSLSLVSLQKYSQLYRQLKSKYGEEIVKIWPESTDPKKFVYEDIAIVTYLLLLWEQTSPEKQTFIDLGCGNGLLVYILTQEGHNGYGIDVRARKIWSVYPKYVQLKVETILPSTDYSFPDVDWLIGNHSDELTPWIPVMAAQSSRKCNFFLLPCCSYEFNGKKYQRMNSSQSQYSDYLDYIKKVCLTCGFKTEIDKLRIPSTKRTCLIGRERFDTDFEDISRNISAMIQPKFNSHEEWDVSYKARDPVEKVRNCTKINTSVISSVVNKVVKCLLSEENIVDGWNVGGKVPFSNLIDLLTVDELKEMKNECGGLQTLLKNHHFIFLVKNGLVQLRMPTSNVNNSKTQNKTRDCWFFINHPNGCPLNKYECQFVHIR